MDVALGKMIEGDAERDAIHIACVPLIAGERYLYAGCPFRVKFATSNVALKGHTREDSIGIVDPFLEECVREGDRFWGVLYPNTVTGMRHHWQHPAFDNVGEVKNIHESWLRDFADRWNFDWDDLIAVATETDEDFRCVVARGIPIHSSGELGEDHALFWHHLEAFTGREFSDEDKGDMRWGCSC